MRLFLLIISIVILCIVFGQTTYAVEETNVSAKHAIVMEMETGRILYDKASQEEAAIASITKIMTALLAIEYGELTDKVKVSEKAANIEGSSLYLQAGDVRTLEELLYGLMLRSGNDAAIAIAEHIGGSVEGFVYLMNEKATLLGMEQTSFANPHGLDAETHYSTAYDMALLMREAMRHPTFQAVAEAKVYEPENQDYKWINKHRLITNMYSHSTGGKTGFTSKAGRTLVTTAKKDGLQLVVVTLNAPNDWQDHIDLFSHGFATYNLVRVEKEGHKTYEVGRQQYEGYVRENVYLPISKAERKHLQKKIILYKQPTARAIGKINYYLHNKQIKTVLLYAKDIPISITDASHWERNWWLDG